MKGQRHASCVPRAVALADDGVGTQHHAHGRKPGAVRPGVAQRNRRQHARAGAAGDDYLDHTQGHHAHLRGNKRRCQPAQSADLTGKRRDSGRIHCGGERGIRTLGTLRYT